MVGHQSRLVDGPRLLLAFQFRKKTIDKHGIGSGFVHLNLLTADTSSSQNDEARGTGWYWDEGCQYTLSGGQKSLYPVNPPKKTLQTVRLTWR